jgi:hypothetical protein
VSVELLKDPRAGKRALAAKLPPNLPAQAPTLRLGCCPGSRASSREEESSPALGSALTATIALRPAFIWVVGFLSC